MRRRCLYSAHIGAASVHSQGVAPVASRSRGATSVQGPLPDVVRFSLWGDPSKPLNEREEQSNDGLMVGKEGMGVQRDIVEFIVSLARDVCCNGTLCRPFSVTLAVRGYTLGEDHKSQWTPQRVQWGLPRRREVRPSEL